MRSDLGRLDAIAKILQVGPFLGHDPEKWKPVFGKDDAIKKMMPIKERQATNLIRRKLDQILARKRPSLALRSAVVY
jgi:hypothetical protein